MVSLEPRDEVQRVAQLIVGRDFSDEEASAAACKRYLGDEFPILDEDLKDGESLRTAQLALGDASHARPLSDIAQVERRTSTVRVDAWIYDRSGKSVGFAASTPGTSLWCRTRHTV